MATTWRSPDSRPLTFVEQDRVFELQRWLSARKVCEMCGQTSLVDDFGGYGAQPCGDCRREVRRARHWKLQKVPA
jgi:hypothetical protein